MMAGVAVAGAQEAGAPKCPLETGRTYQYQFTLSGKPIGKFTFTCAAEAGALMKVTSHMDLSPEGFRQVLDSTLTVGQDMRPQRSEIKGQAGDTGYQYTCVYEGGRVQVKGVAGGVPMSVTADLPPDWEAFDNNALADISLLAARVGLQPQAVKSLACFNAASCRVLHCTPDLREGEELAVGDRKYQTVRCEVKELKTTLWLAPTGLLIKGEQGPVVFALLP